MMMSLMFDFHFKKKMRSGAVLLLLKSISEFTPYPEVHIPIVFL